MVASHLPRRYYRNHPKLIYTCPLRHQINEIDQNEIRFVLIPHPCGIQTNQPFLFHRVLSVFLLLPRMKPIDRHSIFYWQSFSLVLLGSHQTKYHYPQVRTITFPIEQNLHHIEQLNPKGLDYSPNS